MRTVGAVRRAGLALVALAAAVAVGASGCSSGSDAVAQGETFQFVSPGGKTEIHYDPAETRRPIAHLAGPSVTDPGSTIDLQRDFAGKPVVLNLWGQWCGPCRAEADDLESLATRYGGRGVQVLGIDLRDPNRQRAVDFIRNNGITYPSIWDPSYAVVAALTGFPTSVVPSTLVLDRRHRVAAVYLAEIRDYQLQGLLDRLLDEDDAR